MSTNRPFLANFLAAFRAQSTIKASAAGSQSATGTSSSLSPTQISQSARAIATKASNSGAPSEAASTTHYHHHHHHHHHSSSAAASHSRPHSHTRSPLNQSSPAGDSPVPSSSATPPAPSSPPTPSNPIPIANGPDRQRRGSDSSNGSGGFRDALGPEKWYIGGRTPGGEERFYRLGMVTKGGGRLGGSGRVGSIDQLSL